MGRAKTLNRAFCVWLYCPDGGLFGRVNKSTAALYFHRLRQIIAQESEDSSPLFGEIEVNESDFGGHRKGKRGRGAAGKVPVFSLLKRGGKVYAKVIPNVKGVTLKAIIDKKVVPDSIVYSDKLSSYNVLDVSSVMDTHNPAPGANDDSSGMAVSLESARILSQHKFPATIVFVCVAGEEQGLNGSRHLAKLAKTEGWQLEGVLNSDIVGGDTLQNESLVRVFSQGILPSWPLKKFNSG